MIVGRILEKEKLMKAYESEYSQFVTVYGRRRVGKTFFVRETFDYKFTFEHAGLAKSSMKKQLKAWQSSLFYTYYSVTPYNTLYFIAFSFYHAKTSAYFTQYNIC